MKLHRFLLAVFFITFLAVLYVWQQTEIFRLAYDGQKKFSAFQDLLDKNTVLRYNIKRDASLVRIGNKISQTADFCTPDTYRLVRLSYSLESAKASQQALKKENLAFRFFGIKRRAEAETLDRKTKE